MFKQKKSMFILIAAIALCAIMLCACAEYDTGKLITSGDWQYVKKSDGTISLLNYTGEEADLVIPSEINDLTVTSIGVNTYGVTDENEEIISFDNYETQAMQSITIPETVTEIQEGTFALCGSTRNIYVADANSEYCDVDGVLFTKDMKTLVAYPASKDADTYVIPDGVTRIANSAFYGIRPSLEHVVIPDGVTIIGNYAFNACFLEEIELPNSVMEIGNGAFSGNMESIDIPAYVQTIGDGAFESCYYLKNINVSPFNENYCDIDGVLFTDDGMELIKYPKGREETSYELPNGVASIAAYAFFDSRNLESLTINTVYSIKSSAFYGCDALKDIYYEGTEAMWDNINIETGNEVLDEAEIHYML